MKTINFFKYALIACALLVGFNACNNDDKEPIADFSWKADSENKLQITFTNLSYDATSFAWDFGDGNTSTEVSPVHTYAEKKDYSVTLTVNGKGMDVVNKSIKLSKNAGGSIVTIDGNFSEWAKLMPLNLPATATDLTALKEVKMTADEYSIYVYLKFDKALAEEGVLDIYIDYDVNSDTGMNAWFSAGGIEGLVQGLIVDKDAPLFKYTGADKGSGWDWSEVVGAGSGFCEWSDAKITGDYAEVEVSLNRELMSELKNDYIGLAVGVEKSWSLAGLLPVVGAKPFKLNLQNGAVEANN